MSRIWRMTTWRRGGLAEEQLTRSAIGAFYKVYNTLGFGFLESTYATALAYELTRRGHVVQREVLATVYYEGLEIGRARLDMVVDSRLVIELKSTRLLPPEAPRQLLNYLRATELEVGLLFHFGPDPKFYRQFAPASPRSRSGSSGSSA